MWRLSNAQALIWIAAVVVALAAAGVSVDRQRRDMEQGKRHRLEAVVADYLSEDHRDDRRGGCPFASLGSELARSGDNTRAVATEGLLKMVDIVAAQFRDLRPDVARRRALVMVSTMVGAVTLARMVTDSKLSTTILREAGKDLAAAS